MSAVYAERRIENDVQAAVRELSDAVENPRSENFGADKKGNFPPHVREIQWRYTDIYSRTAAIALERFADVSGGFCAADGVRGEIKGNNAFNDSAAREICADLSPKSNARTPTLVLNGENYYAVFAPVEADKTDTDFSSVSGVFAFQKLPVNDVLSDKFNLVTQSFLLAAVVALVGFAFTTLRRWRSGMDNIESGLRNIAADLSNRIEPPQISELVRISREINILAENLETNLAKQAGLEKDLAQSEKLAALGRVASGAAHEIRNPLAAMKLKIQLAERSGFDKAKLGQTFAVLNEEIGRLDRVVTKMLDAGKPEKLRLFTISPEKILRGRLDLINEKAARQSVEIIANLNAENAETEFDDEKLAQVFDNLLLNALEAMPDGGVLTIETYVENAQLILEFSDTGAGVSDAQKDRIFEPFYTTKDAGTGLGLAISREIMQAHEGNLHLIETEKGAKFRLELKT